MTLAIDTSTAVLKLGYLNERGLLAWSAAHPSRTHAEQILPEMEALLTRAGTALNEVNLIAVNAGPGSFTGLRIGIATAKGLSAALGIPLVLVPGLDAAGQAWSKENGIVVPLIDARKHRLYCARYHRGSRIGDWMDIDLQALLDVLGTKEEVHFCGPDRDIAESICLEHPGWSVLPEDPEREITALAQLGLLLYKEKGPADESAGPIYLRDPDIGGGHQSSSRSSAESAARPSLKPSNP